VDVTARNKNSSVKVAPTNTKPTQGVVTTFKSEVEWVPDPPTPLV